MSEDVYFTVKKLIEMIKNDLHEKRSRVLDESTCSVYFELAKKMGIDVSEVAWAGSKYSRKTESGAILSESC